MPVILSLSVTPAHIYAAGPDGLYRSVGNDLETVAQPQSQLICCAAVDGRLLVGGAPYGVAFSDDQGANWQAGWMDGIDNPVMALAPAPDADDTGVLLAASDGGGILRTVDRGSSWIVCNLGLHSYQVLSLAWAPAPATAGWPAWEVVFAGTDEGIYRSPNGGRGSRRGEGLSGVVQTIAVAPDFESSGVVLAGTEDTGLWRSDDGGRTWACMPGMPAQINALAAGAQGWLLSDPSGLWRSHDGEIWQPLAECQPALALLAVAGGWLSGNGEGMTQVAGI